MVRRVLMIAGEASGEMHGSGVVRELRRSDPDIDVYGIGGDCMRDAGMDVIVHMTRVAFMGFVEVVKHLGTIFEVEQTMERLLDSRRPDVVVLIDYPGFNLRFAKKVRARGIPVLYYISPQVWAWHRGRIATMRQLVNRMKVVFPFEEKLYRDAGIPVEFVGHPLVERIGATMRREEFFAKHGLDPARPLLALLPGSRLQEIERILPAMAGAAARLQTDGSVQAAIGVASNLGADVIRQALPSGSRTTLIEGATYDLMAHADAVVVTSGTATLETGWFGTPMVIVYRTSAVTYAIGRALVRVPWIGLVNIVAGKKIVPELLQHDCTAEAIAGTVAPLLHDRTAAAAMRNELTVIKAALGGPGASRRVADGILQLGASA